MVRITILLLSAFTAVSVNAQTVTEWVSSTKSSQWQVKKEVAETSVSGKFNVTLDLKTPLQTIKGFGTCFNELGWTSLNRLADTDRAAIFRELFAPGAGANFTICRMPVGANDFSRDWYSYNEHAGDFAMKQFSIANDLETLVPYIKMAQQYNPALALWASPWSPPSWMKYNKHYALRSLQKGITNTKSEKYGIDFTGLDNGLNPKQQGREGQDLFIQEDRYFKAYALYFAKFIRAYREQKIRIGMVMPQNEFNSAQPFPSCTWTAKGLTRFIKFLGPQMNALGVDIFFGTMERPNEKLADTILTDAGSRPYIKGAGFQWAGKEAIPGIHKRYPKLTLYQSEQECGNGDNDWAFAMYSWNLMKHYFNNGARAYMYWNTSLLQGSISRWGWKQNSLISVIAEARTYQYNYDYYVVKHLSHYVRPGARLLATSGTFSNLLAFMNPDKSIIIIIQNDKEAAKVVPVKIGRNIISIALAPDSINTLVFK